MYSFFRRGGLNYPYHPFIQHSTALPHSLALYAVLVIIVELQGIFHPYFKKRPKEKFVLSACKWLMMAHFGCREGICQNSSNSCMDWTGGQMKRIACAVSMETNNLMSGRLKMREIENDVIKSVYYINKQWHLLSFQQI